MPTTRDENEKILRIALEYLPRDKLQELFERLWRDVGATSWNASVRESLRALRWLTTDLGKPSGRTMEAG
jgi:hypothetical protein